MLGTFLKTLNRSFALRTRLTILFAVIFGSTTIVFSIFAYYLLDRSLLTDFDNALYNYSIDVSQTIEIGPKNDLSFPPLKVDEGKIFPFPSGTALILVRHISGEILARSGELGTFNPPYKSDFKKILSGDDSSYRTLTNINEIPEAEAGSYRLITFPLETDDPAPVLFLQIAAPMVTFERQLEQFQTILIFGLPAILFVAVLAGLFVSSRALRPVQEIILKTNLIGARDLHERVPLPQSNDEIKTLAETLNRMLERIESAFSSQEKFVADASHQLLTPLTILKGEVELQQKSDSNTLNQKFYSSALQEIDNLSKIVRDMLLLARIDAGMGSLRFSELYLDELVLEIVPRLQKLADQKNIQIKIDIQERAERKKISGEHDLLSNLFTNILENAIKYSPESQTVRVSIIWKDTSTRVEVEDFGVGIPESMRTQIFNRFSRADTSSKTKGFGLGLAIAQKIANLHKTDIKIDNKQTPGSVFSIEIKNI